MHHRRHHEVEYGDVEGMITAQAGSGEGQRGASGGGCRRMGGAASGD